MVLSGLLGVGEDRPARRPAVARRQPSLGHQHSGAPRAVDPGACRPGGARRRPRGRPPAPRPRSGRSGRRRPQGLRAPRRARRPQGHPPDAAVEVAATKGRADSGDLELDLVELFTDVGALAGDLGVGVALFVDEMQDIATPELAGLRCRPRLQPAGLAGPRGGRRPPAPAGGARLREVVRRAAVPLRLGRPAAPRDGRPGLAGARRGGGRGVRAGGARRALRADRRLPLLRPGLRQGHLGRRRRLPDHRRRRPRGRPRRRGRAGRRVLRRPVRPRDPGRA